MKNSLLLFFTFLCTTASLFSCRKQHFLDEPPGHQFPPVFNSYEAAGSAVSGYLQQAGQGETFIKIDNILFLESGNSAYALVYYESSAGHSNILYEQQYQNGQLAAGKVYKCTGANCDCKVLVTIAENGSVSYDCSCSTCSMTIDPF